MTATKQLFSTFRNRTAHPPKVLRDRAGLDLAQELAVLLSDPVLDQRDHDRDHQCPDRQVVCGGRPRRGE